MKPKELMIGDWVFNTHHEKNIQITPYDFFTHGHYPDGTQYITISQSVVSGQDFEPIPITPEILEKNGFEQFPSSKIISYSDSDSDVTLDYDSTKHVWYFSACNDDVDIAIITINYVHELQHAIRLCKINKEIKL